jgi:hypothetical protein
MRPFSIRDPSVDKSSLSVCNNAAPSSGEDSLFFYFIYKNPNYVISYDKDLTFEEYVLNPSNDLEYCNLQARMLTGELDNPHPNYKKACAYLNEHFAFVGLTEQYDISLFLFMQMMNWQPRHFPKINITKNRPAELSLSREAVKNVILKNEVDRKLCEMAYRQFNERVLKLPYEQKVQLKAFLRAGRKRT